MTLCNRQEWRLGSFYILMEGICEDSVQRNEHCGNFLYLVNKGDFLIREYFEHEGLERVKATVGEDALDDFDD